MKRIIIFLHTILAVFALSSCSNFEDINANPDTSNKVTAAMLCTDVTLSTIKNAGDAKSYIAPNGLAKYIGYTEGLLAEQYNDIGNISFSSMTVLPNLDKMVQYASESYDNDNSYRGVALFVKSYIFFRLTMQVGDIPFTEANKVNDAVYRPKYDTQEQVFIGILDSLKKADQYFAQGASFDGDPIYNGDPAKWRKATNTLALKVLMSLSKKADVTSLNVKSRFQAIVSAGNLMASNDDNYELKYADNSGQYHPLYTTGTSIFTPATLPGTLLVDNLKALNDYRLFYYTDPSVVKLGDGLAEDDYNAYLGVDVTQSYAQMQAILSSGDYSPLNTRYATLPASEPRILLSYGEQQLILAEAVLRGWISGDAKTYYETGVSAALAFVGATDPNFCHGRQITSDYIANYFTGEAAFKTTADDQMKQIWMQRYLLNFMQDPQFSYFEYRRTGYPVFPVDPSTNLNVENTKIPMRYLYPTSETDYNIDNLTAALNSQYDGYDEVNKIMWILK